RSPQSQSLSLAGSKRIFSSSRSSSGRQPCRSPMAQRLMLCWPVLLPEACPGREGTQYYGGFRTGMMVWLSLRWLPVVVRRLSALAGRETSPGDGREGENGPVSGITHPVPALGLLACIIHKVERHLPENNQNSVTCTYFSTGPTIAVCFRVLLSRRLRF